MKTTTLYATQENRAGARHQGRAQTQTRQPEPAAATAGVVVVDLMREVR